MIVHDVSRLVTWQESTRGDSRSKISKQDSARRLDYSSRLRVVRRNREVGRDSRFLRSLCVAGDSFFCNYIVSCVPLRIPREARARRSDLRAVIYLRRKTQSETASLGNTRPCDPHVRHEGEHPSIVIRRNTPACNDVMRGIMFIADPETLGIILRAPAR